MRLTTAQARPWQLVGAPFMLAIVLGVPVSFFVILRRVARPGAFAHLKPRKAAELERRYLLRYGQLYQLYKSDCWWWELVEISRKLLLIAVLGQLDAGSLGQLWFAISVSLTAILLLTYFSPYADTKCAARAAARPPLTAVHLLLTAVHFLLTAVHPSSRWCTPSHPGSTPPRGRRRRRRC